MSKNQQNSSVTVSSENHFLIKLIQCYFIYRYFTLRHCITMLNGYWAGSPEEQNCFAFVYHRMKLIMVTASFSFKWRCIDKYILWLSFLKEVINPVD